jgi:DNA uptake protein ComE-like DNA-binding protein
LEIPAKEADAIVKYRTANGAFKDLDALAKVPDVDAKKLAERRDRITFK